MEDREDKYFNFPIHLIRGAINNISDVCDNIMDYAIYTHSLDLEGAPEKRIKDSGDYFGVNVIKALPIIEKGNRLFDSTPERSAMAGISKALAFDYLKNNKTEYEIALLLSNIALKSIIGPKPFCRITNDFWFTRMAGYTSLKEISQLPPELEKYKTRWYTDKLKYDLQDSFKMVFYARYCRGFYCTQELTLEELVRQVEAKRKEYLIKIRIRKKEQRERVKKILDELNGEDE